jgi:arylsulfatase A-like enzyme
MLAALLVALASAQQLRRDDPAPRAERPSIVLVTVDTLRREHLGCYGYPRPTSPRVDALAAESVLFERAYATMAMTFPSHLSMLTGLYVHQHGRGSNHEGVRNPFVSAAGHASIADALGSIGYRTAGMVSSTVLHEHTGIGAGFETYHGPRIRDRHCRARETMDRTLSWLHFPDGTVPQPARNGALVSLVDLMPTLLAALRIGGLEPYLAQCTGRNALNPGFARDGIVTTAVARQRREYAFVTGRWKYVQRQGSPGRLYDLEGAGEAQDVSAGNEAIARELEALLAHELERAVAAGAPPGELDPAARELLDQLEELGYGGGDEDE